MARTSLNWAVPLSVLAFAMACGSSGNKNQTNGNATTIGGASDNTMGSASSNAGNANAGVANSGTSGNGGNGGAGSGNAGAANAGSGTAGDSSLAGSGAMSTNGGANDGGAGNGGDNTNAGANNGGSAGDGTSVGQGGANSQDVVVTGGAGNSQDNGTGGSGNSQDIGTGGGVSFDVPTGGGNSQDVPTGGGNSQDVPTGGGNSQDVPTGGGNSQDTPTGGAPSFDVLNCTKTDLTDINVYVIKDATPSGADTEGNMYVGGNLNPANNGYSIGAKDTIDCTRYSLVVQGDVSNVVVKGGKAVVAGTVTNSTDQDCGGIPRGNPPVDFTKLEAEVEALSLKMAALPTNCTNTTNSAGELVLTGTDPNLNVCSVDASQLATIHVNFPANSAVIVNVTGTTVSNWSGSVYLNGQPGDSTQADSVVWNMYQATSITLGGIAVEGSILAPLATIEGSSGGHVAGQVIVRYLKGGTEYHPYYFSACIKWPAS